MTNNKNLFLISYSYPPIQSAESLLVYRTAIHLANLGWKITVLTTNAKQTVFPIDNSIKYSHNNIKIFRTNSHENILTTLPYLRVIFFRIIEFLGVPESGFLWYPGAMKIAKKILKGEKFQAIYSRACPHVSNLDGLKIKKISGIRWVSHFSDPWLNNPYYKMSKQQKSITKKIEKDIIRYSDVVVYTTKEAANVSTKEFGSNYCKKISVQPHGYDDSYILTHGLEKQIKNTKMKIVYTGVFYDNIRTPISFLEAISLINNSINKIEDLEVLFIGPDMEKYELLTIKLQIDKIVRFTGNKSFIDCQRYLWEADVLLVIDAISNGPNMFFPSKLVDYLAFKKPILGLTPIKGPTAEILNKIGSPIINPNDRNEIGRVILEFLIRWRENTLEIINPMEAEKYNMKNVINDLDRLLQNISI